MTYITILAKIDQLSAPRLDAPRDEHGDLPYMLAGLNIQPECIATAERIDDLPSPQQLASEYESNHDGETL